MTHCQRTGKIGYPNQSDACRVRDKIIRRDKRRTKTNVYHCDACGAWHIGRERNSKPPTP